MTDSSPLASVECIVRSCITSLKVSSSSVQFMYEEIVFMVMTGSLFCCLCLVIGGSIGYAIRNYTEGSEDKIYE